MSSIGAAGGTSCLTTLSASVLSVGNPAVPVPPARSERLAGRCEASFWHAVLSAVAERRSPNMAQDRGVRCAGAQAVYVLPLLPRKRRVRRARHGSCRSTVRGGRADRLRRRMHVRPFVGVVGVSHRSGVRAHNDERTQRCISLRKSDGVSTESAVRQRLRRRREPTDRSRRGRAAYDAVPARRQRRTYRGRIVAGC
jgi:hypothetical protein